MSKTNERTFEESIENWVETTKKTFEKQAGYPNGRPGYVVDHIKPLKEGGADDPSNMQWQTVKEAKEKDKVE